MVNISLLIFYSCSVLHIVGVVTTEIIKDPETIVSANGNFKLGFFSPSNSTNRYLGIWYNKVTVMDVVWVANRNDPIDDSLGVLRLSEDGNLQVLNARKDVIWSSNVTQALPNTSRNTHLLDSGNLCLLEHDMNMTSGTSGTVIWQSFDHPVDSVLPNMTLKAKSSNMNLMLQPWKSPSDPSSGRFSLGIDSFSHPNLVIWDRGRPYWRSGPWNGNIFLGLIYSNLLYYADTYIRQNEQGEFDIVYTGTGKLAFSHYVFNYDGTLSGIWWDESKRAWKALYRIPGNPCDFYNKCGNFATCNSVKSPICQCLRGFRPRNAGEWSKGNWSSGCIRHSPLQCKTQQDGFFAVKRVKGPDNPEWLEGLTPINCETQCLESCSCLAYAYDLGAGCMHWSRALIDIQQLPSDGLVIYVRLPLSELGNEHKLKAVIAVAVILGSGFIVIIFCFYWRCKTKVSGSSNQFDGDQLTGSKYLPEKLEGGRSHGHVEDLPLLKFEDLVVATDGFHERHKLGRGGFGQVYKGRLKDGEEIAVKRLSATSGQGLEEFQNEVVVISRLQHRNLVRLVGYCAAGDEKMLVYEYMPNKSLDAFLFDPDRQKLLDWGKRFNIIEGIGRGLTYLHRDSRLRIIHRDLKASNILLDNDLNPKISDFGLARIFMYNQDQDETKRVVGTCGYMSPEYAMEGHFSEKSDVYSFGVLVLEIVTGRRSSTFWTHDNSLTLLGYVWKLWNKKSITVMIDPVISDPEFRKDVERCIQVGLLCVQDYAKDRPSAATVVSMLTSEIVKLPSPKQPGFSKHLTGLNTTSSSSASSFVITRLSAR